MSNGTQKVNKEVMDHWIWLNLYTCGKFNDQVERLERIQEGTLIEPKK